MRRGRHRTEEPNENFARGFTALGELASTGVQVSARAIDLATGKVLVLDRRPHRAAHRVASARSCCSSRSPSRLTERELRRVHGILDKTPRDSVGDSGIWQHLQAPSLPRRRPRRRSSGRRATTSPPTCCCGTSASRPCAPAPSRSASPAPRCSTWCATTAAPTTRRSCRSARPRSSPGCSRRSPAARSSSPEVSQRVVGWLSLNSDLSMVASAFGLDPLAHRMRRPRHAAREQDRHRRRRAQPRSGVLRGPRASVAYAVSM